MSEEFNLSSIVKIIRELMVVIGNNKGINDSNCSCQWAHAQPAPPTF